MFLRIFEIVDELFYEGLHNIYLIWDDYKSFWVSASSVLCEPAIKVTLLLF